MPSRAGRSFDSDTGSGRSDGSGKERLKWTDELHDLFEKAVSQLGGPDRATPKGILKAMGIPELTIYHVKSHLQKYRMSKFIPESSNRGKFERRNISEILPNFSTTSCAQLNEALQIQKEAERRLSEQLEVQRSLKLKIEAQGRYLERIQEDFNNRINNAAKPGKAFSPISMLSICEKSNSNAKESESDLEIDKAEAMSEEEFRGPKRLRAGDDDVFVPRYMFHSESFNQSKFLSKRNNFPWSVTSCNLPLMPSLYTL
ncbi:myb family transcription factor PHL7-like [Actinidia eriantha]|uniref:myb family transcription factor PHL7-like n=1 Tax=Actinidia eriantha TaxID=165200 RepID=UPI00258FB4C2|nr:myb family transcription factor PHL7-like [Actinidia eriantha]